MSNELERDRAMVVNLELLGPMVFVPMQTPPPGRAGPLRLGVRVESGAPSHGRLKKGVECCEGKAIWPIGGLGTR